MPLHCAAGVVEPALGPAAGQVVCGGCRFACLWRFLEEEEAALGNHSSAQPCQCVSAQLWAIHGPLQGQMQPLQCSAGLVEPALGAAAGRCRWFGRVMVLLVSGVVQRWRLCSVTTAHRAPPVCVTSPGHAVGHWKVKCNLCRVHQVWWSLYWVLWQGWAGGFWGLRFCHNLEFYIQLRWHRSSSTTHRAVPVFVWPALGMPWVAARSTLASAACNRCGGACTGWCCGSTGLGKLFVVGATFLPLYGLF